MYAERWKIALLLALGGPFAGTFAAGADSQAVAAPVVEE